MSKRAQEYFTRLVNQKTKVLTQPWDHSAEWTALTKALSGLTVELGSKLNREQFDTLMTAAAMTKLQAAKSKASERGEVRHG